jgi:hypothetical protein
MRGILGRLGARGGAAVVLILVIAGVITVGRLAGGATRSTPDTGPAVGPTSVVETSDGDDAETSPTPSTFVDDAAVENVASAFLAAWLKSDLSSAKWHSGLAPLSTMSLAQSLEGVDPAGVPATRATGPPTIVRRDDVFAQVSIAVDTGTVVLNLTKHGSTWLVDGVDWDRA